MPAVSESLAGVAGPLMHVSLNVRDVARSRVFYEAFFGVRAYKVRPGYTNFQLQTPPLKLALTEHPEGTGKGVLNHLGIQVGTLQEVEAARERLVAAGLATFDERDATCCFARQDKVWVRDPDGNAWEIYFVVDDLLDDHGHNHRGSLLPIAGDTAEPEPGQCCPRASAGPVCCAEK
jgi:catechol 2,3-dioxygenase-like lactoylglutathione lyase family enzyme